MQLEANTGTDTIKVRMQLSVRSRAPGTPKRGFLATGAAIMKKETPLGLYKGLGAVVTGIVPKMAIRFTSFEQYKKLLADKKTGAVSSQATFLGSYLNFKLYGSSDFRGNRLIISDMADDSSLSWKKKYTYLVFYSGVGSRSNRSGSGRNTYGGDQDPSPSSKTQHVRPIRHPKIPQRRPRPPYCCERRRFWSSVSWYFTYCFTARFVLHFFDIEKDNVVWKGGKADNDC